MKIILNETAMNLTIKRLCHQIVEQNPTPSQTVLIGLQPRGVHLMQRLKTYFNTHISPNYNWGKLDITFYRDDIKKQLHLPTESNMPCSLDHKNVVLIDDVMFTGRTVRSALDAILDFGRPAQVQLCVLINRNLSREFPIQPDYIGRRINTLATHKVRVSWPEIHGVQQVAVW